MDAPPYTHSSRHLEDELAWVRLAVRRGAQLARAGAADAEAGDYRGLYVSETEVERILGAGLAPQARASAADTRGLDEELRRLRARIDAGVAAAAAAGTELRLVRLQDTFALAPLEVAVLLLCLVPDVDAGLQRVFAFLQDDVTMRRPGHGLIETLLAPVIDGLGGLEGEGRPAVLAAARALQRGGLLAGPEAAEGGDVPLARVAPRVPEVVVDYLLGEDRLAPGLEPFARLAAPRPLGFETSYYDHHLRIVETLLEARRAAGSLPRAYVEGPERAGEDGLVDTLAYLAGAPVLRVDLGGLLEAPELGRLAALLVRDARLHGALVHLRGCEALARDAEGARRAPAPLRRLVGDGGGVELVLTGTEPWAAVAAALGASLWSARLPRPDFHERLELWTEILQPGREDGGEALVEGLAASFRFTPEQIADTVSRASAAAAAANADGARDGLVSLDELYRSCREEARRGIQRFTHCREPRYRWDDLAVPAGVREQLREVHDSVRGRRTVHETWGFGRKLSLGKGLNVLFAGPSGTGKTMCAEILAGELRLDLYKVDLSAVVSKYVGETERNLREIFDSAESGVLFFDEADALFGKRSDVKDAHDRYANIEVNYLLQRMEESSGIVVLATNLKGNLDSAFLRRLHHVVEFPEPKEAERERIWRTIFPADAPVDASVDFAFLARNLELAGGSIKNVALGSAFLAAENGRKVDMRHVIRAARREYQKLGRICSKAEFGPYYPLVAGEGPG